MRRAVAVPQQMRMKIQTVRFAVKARKVAKRESGEGCRRAPVHALLDLMYNVDDFQFSSADHGAVLGGDST